MANRQTTLVLIGTVFAVAALGAVNMRSSSSQLAQVIDELQGVQITPDQDLTFGLEDPISLTAHGDVSTSVMPVRAYWTLRRAEEANAASTGIAGCANVKTCRFSFGTPADAGDYLIFADVSGKRGTVTVTIEEGLRNPFNDDLPAWAQEAIIRMNRLGIIRGYDNGNFGPADPVTRGQIITLLGRMLENTRVVSLCDQESFADTPRGHYAFQSLCAFGTRGWVGLQDQGIDGTFFRPDDAATRAMAARSLSRSTREALQQRDVPRGEPLAFDDVAADLEDAEAIANVSAYGLMTGNPNGDFLPKASLNRAEAAVILYRAWQKLQGGVRR